MFTPLGSSTPLEPLWNSWYLRTDVQQRTEQTKPKTHPLRSGARALTKEGRDFFTDKIVRIVIDSKIM